MSEIVKFYSVGVGTRTRAGNLNVTYSFVAQSDKTQNDVYTFYSSKYRGLAIEVSEITEIVKDDVPKVNVDTYSYGISSEQKRVKELQAQIEELKKGTLNSFDKFSGTVSSRNSRISKHFMDLKKLNDDYFTKVDEINEEVKLIVQEKYQKEIDVYQIEVQNYTHRDDYVPFTVRLGGKILPANNNLE